jgi:hypothetical protein
VRLSRPRIDESTYDWCNRETRESAAFERTSSLVPRCCKHPIAQSGCSETDSWALSKAARVELRADEGLHLQKVENSLVSVDAFLPLHRCLHDYSQPLCIGGDSDAGYMIRCTFSKQYSNLPLSFRSNFQWKVLL